MFGSLFLERALAELDPRLHQLPLLCPQCRSRRPAIPGIGERPKASVLIFCFGRPSSCEPFWSPIPPLPQPFLRWGKTLSQVPIFKNSIPYPGHFPGHWVHWPPRRSSRGGFLSSIQAASSGPWQRLRPGTFEGRRIAPSGGAAQATMGEWQQNTQTTSLVE